MDPRGDPAVRADNLRMPQGAMARHCGQETKQNMAPMKKGKRPVRRPRTNDAMGSRKRVRLLEPNDVVDLDDVEFLKRFVTEFGKIIPARVTGVTAEQQRQIRRGICRARNMGLLA